MPKGSTRGKRKRKKRAKAAVEEVSGETDDWSPEAVSVVNVKFDSEPPGARVSLDGEHVCDATPCKRPVKPGRHRVEMNLARYMPLERTETLEAGKIVGWSLEPNFGTLSVRSDPPGVAVTIDGEAVGTTPLDGLEREDGRYEVEVGGACYRPEVRKVTLPRGKQVSVEVSLTPLPAGLSIQALSPTVLTTRTLRIGSLCF